MPSFAHTASLITGPGLIAVVRGSASDPIGDISEALVAGGFTAIEITMTTPGALEIVANLRDRLDPGVAIGVGTVLDASTARLAISAGAEFLVSPIHRAEIAVAAHQGDCPVMLGAFSPSEAQAAYEMGADFVKLFPADALGAAYVKAVRAALPHLRIVPTGGIDLHNADDFIKAGCVALGVGSSLLSAGIIERADWAALTRLAREFVLVVQESRARCAGSA